MPSEPSALNIFSWLKANFVKLPDYIGGAMDFGDLAFATNLSKMLAQDGCPHTRGVKEGDLGGPTDLGVTSPDIHRSLRHFMTSFWVRFGRAEARSITEARRTEVGFSIYNLFVFVLGTLLLAYCFYNLVLFFAGVAEERGYTWSCWCTFFAGCGGVGSEGFISSC